MIYERKRIKKCLTIFLSLLILVIPFISSFETSAYAVTTNEAKNSKKIISLVYDDSGSMFRSKGVTTPKWARANYALQVFTALLDEQDEMYITYMSDAKRKKDGDDYFKFEMDSKKIVKVDTSKIEDSVDAIRNKTAHGSTPGSAVDLAMDKLNSINDTDENTQYWLVILTDGEMFEGENKNGKGMNPVDLQKKLDGFSGTKMANGSEVYITYMGIQDETNVNDKPVVINGDSSKGFDATVTSDITGTLAEIANKVSGRMLFDDAAITQKGNDTVNIHVDIPLYSIAIFSQKSNAEVVSVSNVDTVRNVPLKRPDAFKDYITDEELFGNAALVKNKSGALIQPGDYEVKFSSDIDKDSVIFMYQPAIVMIPKITKNGGTKISDDKLDALETVLADGDVIDIELVPVDPESGIPIEESKLPKGIQWGISYSVNDVEQKSSSSRTLTGVKVAEGENKITCTMLIPNMTPQNNTYSFTLEKPMEIGFDFDDAGDATYLRSKMGKKGGSGTPCTFQITGNGNVLTKSEMDGIDISIENVTLDQSDVTGSFFETFGIKDANTNFSQEKDGTFIVYPKKVTLAPFLIHPGHYSATIKIVTPDGKAETFDVSYTVVGKWTDWLYLFVLAAILLLIIHILGLLFVKPKFKGQQIIIRQYASDGGSGGNKIKEDTVALKSFASPGDLLSWRASSVSKGKIRFYATSSGGVEIREKTIKSFAAYGSSGLDPIKKFVKVTNSLKPTKGTKNLPKEKSVSSSNPICLYDSSGTLYQIILRAKK